jgi:tetratricopeptide (TPR) repeat protein
MNEAIDCFQRAVEFDTAFAMAYLYLAELKDRAYLEKALHFSERAAWMERQYIFSLEALRLGDTAQHVELLKGIVKRKPDEKLALLRLGQFEQSQHRFAEAIRYYNDALDIDPLFKEVYNQLSYLYDAAGNLEKSLWAINKYIEIAPNEANPYDTRGEIYANNGKLDKAIQSYEEALRLKPDFRGAAVRLGNLYVFKRQYDKAREMYDFPSFGTADDCLRRYLDVANSYIHQGYFDQALTLLDSGLSYSKGISRKPGIATLVRETYFKKATILAETDPESAIVATEKAMSEHSSGFPDDSATLRPYFAALLAAAGLLDSANAVIYRLKDHLKSGNRDLHAYWFAAGLVALETGAASDAAAFLEKAVPVPNDPNDFALHYWLSRGYIAVGKFEQAAEILDHQLKRFSPVRLKYCIWNVEAMYYLGIAFESTEQIDEAIARYQEFFDIWQNADLQMGNVSDTEMRIKRLNKGS